MCLTRDRDNTLTLKTFDPYDIWQTNFGLRAKKLFYSGSLWGWIGATVISITDWLMPRSFRKLLRITPQHYPILSAHACLQSSYDTSCGSSLSILKELRSQVVGQPGKVGWGLRLSWMSKNGLYGSDIAFVTHTPYVMEALLQIAKCDSSQREAMALFNSTWGFLESLLVMYETDDELALSYAPLAEPRIVVNANSYAAFAYALHAVHGLSRNSKIARDKAGRIAEWIAKEQSMSGGWWYYADQEQGNFIDCFHSCFIVKNLIKLRTLLPELADIVNKPIEDGWRFIHSEMYDDISGLCLRFAVRSHYDPYRWELYDQAEYLGLLVDFSLFEQAQEFSARVEKKFTKGGHWYCRIDFLGRKWGQNFLRWGIAPFLYHRARLTAAIQNTKQ